MDPTAIFEGSIVALVTPFRAGEVDLEAVRGLVRKHLAEGTRGILVSGTTGESPTIAEEERLALVRAAREVVAGRIPVIAGTGSNDTAHAIASSRRASEAGADALLLVTPYYNKPTQGGLLAHYRAIADAVDLPICLYSVPGRTGVAIEPETAAALAAHPNILALKEAGGSVQRVSLIREQTELTILSGDDPLAVPMIAAGARGVISVLANVVPGETARMIASALEGDFRTALSLHDRLFPLARALFLETNPIPVKTALALMGWIRGEFRLPLVPMREENRARLASVMRDLGLPLAADPRP